MRSYRSEPTLAEVLSDPIVKALMAADKVAPEELERSLRRIAGSIESRHGHGVRRGCC
jgi:hypothetical protein